MQETAPSFRIDHEASAHRHTPPGAASLRKSKIRSNLVTARTSPRRWRNAADDQATAPPGYHSMEPHERRHPAAPYRFDSFAVHVQSRPTDPTRPLESVLIDQTAHRRGESFRLGGSGDRPPVLRSRRGSFRRGRSRASLLVGTPPPIMRGGPPNVHSCATHFAGTSTTQVTNG